MNKEFKQYKRSNIAEMRPYEVGELLPLVSISQADIANGSPKAGDMIARNPNNHADQWLVAEEYFKENFEMLAGAAYEDKGEAHFLLGKQVRYRYVDWEEGSFTPWATCNESDLKKILEDHSVEIVEFKP